MPRRPGSDPRRSVRVRPQCTFVESLLARSVSLVVHVSGTPSTLNHFYFRLSTRLTPISVSPSPSTLDSTSLSNSAAVSPELLPKIRNRLFVTHFGSTLHLQQIPRYTRLTFGPTNHHNLSRHHLLYLSFVYTLYTPFSTETRSLPSTSSVSDVPIYPSVSVIPSRARLPFSRREIV